MPPLRLALLTGSTLVAFAANSLLCRLALTQAAMDPALFTLLRLASGALMLGWLTRARPRGGDWRGGLALVVYAGAFSFAYLSLGAGSGALILFDSVQITMLAPPLWRGERLPALQWLGLVLAMGGLVWLLLPGLSAPDPLGAVLMTGAGIAWASYTLAAALQLLVPPLAAVGGTLWLGESWSLRLLLSALAILSGIALIIAGRARQGATR